MTDLYWLAFAAAVALPAFMISYGLVAWFLALCRTGLQRMFRQ